MKSNGIFAFAGIHDSWTNPETGELVNTFSVLTTTANSLMEKIHNLKKRMPVILPADKEDEWLNLGSAKDLINSIIKPLPDNLLEAYPVSPKISSKNLDIFDPSLIEPVGLNIDLSLFPD